MSEENQTSQQTQQQTSGDETQQQTTQQQSTTPQQTSQAQQSAAPVAYQLALSQNSPLESSDIDKIAAYARTQGLSNEQAVALLKHQEDVASGLAARQQAARDQQSSQWFEDVKKDKDLGGEKFNATLLNVKRVMDRFAPEGSPLLAVLKESGYGNHPEWVRFVSAIGRAMAEDSTLLGGGGEKKPERLPMHEVFYGKNQ